jgi:hypothetical protein
MDEIEMMFNDSDTWTVFIAAILKQGYDGGYR